MLTAGFLVEFDSFEFFHRQQATMAALLQATPLLRTIHQPELAFVALLPILAKGDDAAVRRARIDGVEVEERSINLDGQQFPVPSHSFSILMAQRLKRTSEGALETDRLLPSGTGKRKTTTLANHASRLSGLTIPTGNSIVAPLDHPVHPEIHITALKPVDD